ncbi:MAG: FAD-dependent monooxygenase [Bacteroidia bacterium]|nr:FAD-dependent monooxygenase [Bacteroidota bacterium]MBL0071691.1 FAD-dependent monooxygenase [Bacteroidota bacterium]MBP9083038.1 FAD-dependent monooxygenase [Bacteroidia bacterium]
MNPSEKKVLLIGAGLVGSLLSNYLTKHGYKVEIFERRSDMRKDKISAGRSINLALSERGWRGLNGVGLSDAVRNVAIPMAGRMIHHQDGTINYQAYGKEGQAIYSVSRGGLNCVLMDESEKSGATIHYNERCTHVDLDKNIASFENVVTGNKQTLSADLIISSDGAYSAGRLSLLFTDRFNYSQLYLEHGYKELTIPPAADGTHQLDKNALHIWPRGGYMLIALPNMDGSFTCTLFFPFEGSPSFAELNSKEKVTTFFKEIFADAYSLMPTLEEDFFNNPTGSLMTVKCFPWTWKNQLALIGDAAHAIVPFYGQGMNCGFEDCVELNDLIVKHNHDWSKIMPEYQLQRKPNSDAIADLAVANFYEMRDLVGHPDFLLRKKIEARIFDKHPEKWVPLYTMVTFNEFPYSEALSRGKRQDQIMDKVMALPDIEKIWDSPEVESKILNMLS